MKRTVKRIKADDDDEFIPDDMNGVFPLTVLEQSDEPVYTGVLDQFGEPIFRESGKNPIGYIWNGQYPD